METEEQQPDSSDKPARPPINWRRVIASALLIGIVVVPLYMAAHYVLAWIVFWRVDARIAELKAQGAPMSWEELKPAPVSPEQNGATDFIAAGAAFDLAKDEEDALYNAPKLALAGKLSSKELVMLDQAIQHSRKTLALLERGLQKSHVQFDGSWDQPLAFSYRGNSTLRRLTRLECGNAVLLAAHGQPTAAMQAISKSLQLSEAAGQGPGLIPFLIRMACKELTGTALQSVLALTRPSPQALKGAFEEFSQFNDFAALTPALEAERASGIWCFDQLRHWRLSLGDLIGDEKGEPRIPSKLLPGSRGLMQLVYALDESFYLSAMQSQLDAVKRVEKAPWTTALEQEPHLHFPCVASAVLLPVVTHTLQRTTEVKAELDAARCGLAVVAFQQETGKDPASLAEVEKTLGWKLPLDPGSGKVFKLVHEGKLLRVESVLTENAGQDKTRQISFSVPEL